MSYFQLLHSVPEGIIEIEESYLRFLLPEGRGWKAHHIPIQSGDALGTLRTKIPELLGHAMQASVVLWNDASSRILPFPVSMKENEILHHLALKREDYFGSNAEMVFALKPLSFLDQKNREYLVSSVNRGFYNRLVNLFAEVGCTLNRVTTALEASVGRFQQLRDKYGHDESVCIISLGYSQVNMIVLRSREVKAVRTSLTGSIKELESRLADALKLKTEKIEEYLTGRIDNPDANTLELIQQNMRELLARITPFFAFIRSKEKEKSVQTIFLGLPCIHVRGLKEMLEQAFTHKVISLDTEKEGVETPHFWLEGALHPQTVSLLAPRPPFFRFSLTPSLAWLFTIFFLCVPWAFIRMNDANVKQQIQVVKSQEEQGRRYLERDENSHAQQAILKEITTLIQGEIPGKVAVSSLLVEIAGRVPANVRIAKFEYAPDSSLMTLAGVALDTETALAFWESLKQLSILKDPKISFAPGANDFSKGFIISTGVNR